MKKMDALKLPANATLIQKKALKNSPHLSVVIAKTDTGEFVTWIYNHDFQGCVSGHYFTATPDGLRRAVEDFLKRN